MITHSRPTATRTTVAQWYCLVVGLFLLIRSVTTLLGDPVFATPGSGWRAVLQAVVAVALLAGLRTRPVPVVVAVGALYASETVLGALGGDAILGIIPVDMRDRIVHPTLAIAAALVVLVARRGGRADD
ncbi:hypothetical protein [Nocardia xishanensis]|uniref:hypothetical protein n=1 Tax=Nocardia xishanensis TaxID=238964 RepID=UPI000B3222D4|nr:hypothetical protein [Nocardia xishanensis]